LGEGGVTKHKWLTDKSEVAGGCQEEKTKDFKKIY